ncbi:LytTR family DNA-binding domain-containing protein [candidate division KSB1 bacterium]|nr:LytTR family DNA-binding domain-containing protein [candidate division KSB1 bacterium]
MSTKIRALIADDEPLARKGVQAMLKGEADVAIIGESADGLQTVAAIQEKSPDLVFLDVQMPGLDGFGVIEQVGVENVPVVIFVTAYDLHALRAFQVHAIDYLLKPLNAERFHIALGRARALLQQQQFAEVNEKLTSLLNTLRANRAYPERFIIKSLGSIEVVKVSDLDWIEAEGDYVRLHAQGKSHLLREKISALETQLDPAVFVRIHRSIIVRLDRIATLKPQNNGDHVVLLRDGRKLSLSRTYHDRVFTALKIAQ